jgi:hypothetical protein
MHAVGQQSIVETLSITVAKQRINTQHWKRPALSMRSEPSLHATVEGTVVFYGVWSGQQCVFFGVRPRGYITRVFSEPVAVSYELLMTSDGKGCHKSWLQQLEPGSSEQEKRLSCCEL